MLRNPLHGCLLCDEDSQFLQNSRRILLRLPVDLGVRLVIMMMMMMMVMVVVVVIMMMVMIMMV